MVVDFEELLEKDLRTFGMLASKRLLTCLCAYPPPLEGPSGLHHLAMLIFVLFKAV
jgi:hypothetical protein